MSIRAALRIGCRRNNAKRRRQRPASQRHISKRALPASTCPGARLRPAPKGRFQRPAHAVQFVCMGCALGRDRRTGRPFFWTHRVTTRIVRLGFSAIADQFAAATTIPHPGRVIDRAFTDGPSCRDDRPISTILVLPAGSPPLRDGHCQRLPRPISPGCSASTLTGPALQAGRPAGRHPARKRPSRSAPNAPSRDHAARYLRHACEIRTDRLMRHAYCARLLLPAFAQGGPLRFATATP